MEYTCPMHPEIVRDEPGSCPICGMTLEPMTVSANEPERAELLDMTRRFWVSTALTIPVFLIAMSEYLPACAAAGSQPRTRQRASARRGDREWNHAMYQSWQRLLPGFTWISWGSFCVGLVESYGDGWHVALIWVPLYNVFASRPEARRG